MVKLMGLSNFSNATDLGERKILKSKSGTELPKTVLVLARCHDSKVKWATVVEIDAKAPFSIATTPRCRGGRYSFP